MIIHEFEQGSPEWFSIRSGKPTASCFEKIITPTGKASTQFEGYMNQLLAEILTGGPVESWEGNMWTERGKELEPDAADYYEIHSGIEPIEVGFITDDNLKYGCSPDRLIGDDGLLEIKCPAPHTHVQNLLTGKIDSKYNPQIQGQLLVTGRKWVDWMSYHPKMKPCIVRVNRDEDYINELEILLNKFVESMNIKLKKLKES